MGTHPRAVVMVSMLWLGALIVTSTNWWKGIRDYVEKLTH